MKHQRHVRKFPTEKPPDLESKSPGAVGTATGTDFQTVLQKTNESYREPNVNDQSAAVLSTERSVSSNGGHCDRYILVLDGGPLFAVTLTAERGATSVLLWDGGNSETQKPHQNTAETEATSLTTDMVTPLVAIGAGAGRGVVP